MNINVTFKNFEPSEHLRKYAKRRFEKLGRFLHKADNVEMTAVLAVDKFRHKADVQVTGDNMNLSAVEESPDMYATVDLILEKLGAQVKKHNERSKEKRGRSGRDIALEVFNYTMKESPAGRIVEGTDKFEPKPLFADEAAMQLEQRSDDEFLVFLNAENERINVLYRLKHGGFGLIDPRM